MADKQYKVCFRCPNPECKCRDIEEVMVGVTKFSPVTDIADLLDGSAAIDYGNSSDEDGQILHYACLKCEYTLRNESDDMPITDPPKLFEGLQRHGMVEEVG